jgi:hypothetical protein
MAKRKISNYKTDRGRKHHHWFVSVTYFDKESFGRVYIDRERAKNVLSCSRLGILHLLFEGRGMSRDPI